MKRLAATLAASLAISSPAAFAAVDDAAVNELRAQIAALTERLNQIEESNKETQQQVVKVKESSEKLIAADKISIKGDFRYRFETIDDNRRDNDRERNRIRARAEISAQVTDDLKIGLGLASGGEDPVSTNQTLGDGGSSKDLRLDLAYYDWGILENLHWVGGKYKNPNYRPQNHGLVWDGDFRPEGMSFIYDNEKFFGNIGYNFINSDSGSSGSDDTETIITAQAGYRANLGDNLKAVFGASYFYIPLEGTCADILDFEDEDDDACNAADENLNFFGNSLNDDGTFKFDYEIVQAFAELHTELFDLPVVFFGDFIQNQDADEDTGYAVGFKLGKAKNPGSWQFQYTYQDLEADATLGVVTDSDFAGGGTDNSGHVIKGAYQINRRAQVAATYFINEYGDFTRGEEFDYDRLQLDLKFKY